MNWRKKQSFLFPPSIQDFISPNHLARVIDEVVAKLDLTPFFKKIPPVGNPSYHPALMIKIWVYGYATGIYSSRQIEEKLYSDVAFMFLAGMQNPDFKTISEFRRKNLKELKKVFIDVLQTCYHLGMLSFDEISLDSTVIKANASPSKTYDIEDLMEERVEIEKAVSEYLERVKRVDNEEDQKYGPDKRGGLIREGFYKGDERSKEMDKIMSDIKQIGGGHKSSHRKKTYIKKINLTDRDARFQMDKQKLTLGYRAQIAVDSKEQIIVANDVTEEQNDKFQLIPMVDKVIENVERVEPKRFSEDNQENKGPIKLCADSGYSSGRNLKELEKEEYREKIDAYIYDEIYQAKKRGKKSSPFDKEKFVYDEGRDEFICPTNQKLYYSHSKFDRNKQVVRVYRCAKCRGCRYFGQCTIFSRGRTIEVSENEPFIKKMREKLSSREGREIYKRRQRIVEPVFGNLVYNLGIKEFSLRGKEKVRGGR
ncbi:MAG: IS1182 family transposase [Thermodesulfobacteriaceae bacterium]|nr:IS1182 family transposase [Thermodesulfobacteriaceae bacterium]